LAAVRVRDGRIVDKAMWMIRPKPFFFSRANIQIHGICPEQVQHEPEFAALWDDIATQIGSDCLVAHNAGFDIGVLRACLTAHGKTIPEFRFTCTRAIARRAWPHRRRYGLKPLAEWLGIRFQHHDALEDSVACTKILLAAGIDAEASDLEDLERKLRLSRGSAGQWGQRLPGSRGRRKQPTAAPPSQPPLPFYWPTKRSPLAAPRSNAALDLQRLMVRAELIRPLSGRVVVFAGRFRSLSPQDAQSLATRLGGQCQESLSELTDIVVLGSESRSSGGESVGPASVEVDAKRLRDSGNDIRILSEDDFLGLVISPQACE
jgi:DNA polymerase-3 subunit epsilon